jgi:hypothetical protein
MTTELMKLVDVEALAVASTKTGFFPGVKTKEDALVLMMLSQAEGLHPMQALRMFHVINGRPVMRADAMLARFQQAGGKVKWLTSTSTECAALFSSPGVDGTFESAWNIAKATASGLTNNPTWKKFPDAMLRARVVSDGIRATMPAVVVGLYTPEEVQDFEPVTSEPKRIEVKIEEAPEPPKEEKKALDADAQTLVKEAVEKAFPLLSEAKESRRVASELRGAFLAKVLGRKPKGYGDMTPDEAKMVIEAAEYGDKDA